MPDDSTMLRMALVEEYRVVLHYRTLYHELSEGFFGLLKEVVAMQERNQFSSSEDARIRRMMNRAEELIQKSEGVSPEMKPEPVTQDATPVPSTTRTETRGENTPEWKRTEERARILKY